MGVRLIRIEAMGLLSRESFETGSLAPKARKGRPGVRGSHGTVGFHRLVSDESGPSRNDG